MNDLAMKRVKRLTRQQRFSPIAIFLALFIIMTIVSPTFLQRASVMNLLKQCAVYGILAIGETFVIMTGGIDLSVSAVCGFTGCFVSYLNANAGMSAGVAILLGLIVALVVGLINGVLTAIVDIPDFIATLGTQTILSGLALLITGGLSITGISKTITVVGGKSGFGIGFPFASLTFLIILLIAWFLQEKTTLGRNILAIGGNKEAARVSGVRIVATKIIACVLSAIFSAIGGMVLIGRLNSANALMGGGYELDAIACVVIGGTSINGGRGKMLGTLIGVLTMATINTGMDMAGLASYYQDIILGIVIVLVLAMDCTIRKKLSDG